MSCFVILLHLLTVKDTWCGSAFGFSEKHQEQYRKKSNELQVHCVNKSSVTQHVGKRLQAANIKLHDKRHQPQTTKTSVYLASMAKM